MKRRRRILVVVCGIAVLAGSGSLAAHDLFLKLTTYFLPPNTAVRAHLLNGTFTRSENSVTRDRVADISLVGGANRVALDTTALAPKGDSTWLGFQTGTEGTYLLGLSVHSREVALTGEQFNGYLREEGLDDVLADRTRAGALTTPARERYTKHVKAIFQVGTRRTDQFGTVLGNAAEIVPLDNPYELKPGNALRVRCFVNGIATPGLVVLAGGLSPAGAPIPELRARTDSAGIASLPVAKPGRWYVKFISMRPSSAPGLTHESLWATLTFQLR